MLEIAVSMEYRFPRPAEVLLQLAVADMPGQTARDSTLEIAGGDNPVAVSGPEGSFRHWTRGAGGLLHIQYRAMAVVSRPVVDLAALPATALAALPGDVVDYLLPSRYCEVHRLSHFVETHFAGLAGGALAAALTDWVAANMRYQPGVSHIDSGALHTFAERRGVCRDYAHLLVTLARAGGIPARVAAVYAPRVDPPDFHAVAQLWLGGKWHLVDPTGMATPDEMAVIATGRDATDIAFMTIFGIADCQQQAIAVRLVDG